MNIIIVIYESNKIALYGLYKWKVLPYIFKFRN